MTRRVYGFMVAAIAFVLLASCATTTAIPPEERDYQEVFDADGSQDELYRKANTWMVNTFVSAESVIQYQDKDEGIIMGKGRATTPRHGIKIQYTLTIEVRDDRARLSVTDASLVPSGDAIADAILKDIGWNERTHADYLVWIDALAADFETAMNEARSNF